MIFVCIALTAVIAHTLNFTHSERFMWYISQRGDQIHSVMLHILLFRDRLHYKTQTWSLPGFSSTLAPRHYGPLKSSRRLRLFWIGGHHSAAGPPGQRERLRARWGAVAAMLRVPVAVWRKEAVCWRMNRSPWHPQATHVCRALVALKEIIAYGEVSVTAFFFFLEFWDLKEFCISLYDPTFCCNSRKKKVKRRFLNHIQWQIVPLSFCFSDWEHAKCQNQLSKGRM